MKYLKTLGFIFLYIVVYLGINLFIGAAFTLGIIVRGLFLSRGTPDMNAIIESLGPELTRHTTLLLLVINISSFFIFWLISILRKENLFEVCGFLRINAVKAVMAALAGISACIFISYGMSIIIEKTALINNLPDYEKIIGSLSSGNIILDFICVGLLTPVFEEIFFRGIIFRELRRSFSTTVSVIIQGILFGVFHMNLIQGIYAAILGLLLGFVYVWAKTLWAPILVHVFFNSTSTLMSQFVSEETMNAHFALFMIISVVLLAFAVACLWRKRRDIEVT